MHKYIIKSEFNDEVNQLLSPDYLDRCWADAIGGVAPVDDDTNYTVLALKLLEKYGHGFHPNDVLEAWLLWVPMLATSTAERTAYRNAATGKLAPQTATYQNPCREWIGAQIRGDFFGYINPANPEKAAEMAWRDASISHVKNGIYGEMFISAMIAAASVCSDVMKVIEAGLDEIPINCRLRKGIEQVIAMYGHESTEDDVIGYIHSHYTEHESHGWCHTVPNAMIVVMALLYGNTDFGRSLCLAVQAAFDTDCNGATVGSVVGIMNGAKSIPKQWYEPYNMTLSSSIIGYPVVSVEELTRKTLLLCNVK
jgi:ADP-ribosylglycohydrolase